MVIPVFPVREGERCIPIHGNQPLAPVLSVHIQQLLVAVFGRVGETMSLDAERRKGGQDPKSHVMKGEQG